MERWDSSCSSRYPSSRFGLWRCALRSIVRGLGAALASVWLDDGRRYLFHGARRGVSRTCGAPGHGPAPRLECQLLKLMPSLHMGDRYRRRMRREGDDEWLRPPAHCC